MFAIPESDQDPTNPISSNQIPPMQYCIVTQSTNSQSFFKNIFVVQIFIYQFSFEYYITIRNQLIPFLLIITIINHQIININSQPNKTNMSESKVYTWEEIAKHNTDQDLWIVIDNQVYDVTSYANEHPGGPIVFSSKAGRNSTLAFDQAAHSKNAIENIRPQFNIGKVDEHSVAADWQKQAMTIGIVAVILVVVYLLAA